MDELLQGLPLVRAIQMLLHGKQPLLGVLEVGLEEAANAIPESFVGEMLGIERVAVH